MATLAACALGAVLAGLSPIDARADETPPPVNRIVPTRQPQQPAPTQQPEQPAPTQQPTPEPTPEPTPQKPTHDNAISNCEEGRQTLVPTVPPIVSQIGMERAWSLTKGGGVTVAVVDSGIAEANPHFDGALAAGVDLTRAGGATEDASGQGTAVAGAIGARSVSGSGLVGLASEATLMPVRVFTTTSSDASGSRTATGMATGRSPQGPQTPQGPQGPQPERTAEGIRWAVDNGARVIVVPQALTEDAPALREATEHAIDSGALVVASTGDRSQSSQGSKDEDESPVRYPAAYDGVLGVTALTSQGSASEAALRNEGIDLAVPAQSETSAFLGDGDCVIAQESPSSALATGYAGGVAALVAAAHPDETPADWAYRLTVTALRTTPAEWSSSVGWGTIAPYSALTFINDGTALGPANPRGSRTLETAAPVMATPPQPDLGPQRRQRLAGTVGLGGATALTLALIASQAPRRADARTKKGEPHAR